MLRALRLGLARAAGDGLGLPLAVIGAKQVICRQADLAAKLSDDRLLMLFLSEARAAAICLDGGCVSAIMQQQTIGMVTPDAPLDRACTDTDAAMAAPLFEDTMARARDLVEASNDIASLSGYEYGSRVESTGALMLAMTEETYRVVDLTVELAGGARQGEICMLLPEPPVSDDDQSHLKEASGRDLQQASGVMRAELMAILSRVSLPFTSLSGLTVGDVLPLSSAKLDKVEILTIDRGRMTLGRLGQCGGMRAVRINEDRALTALTANEPQSFLASTSGPDSSTGHAEDGVYDLHALTPTPEGDDVLEMDSVQMVSEISQLAGLSDADGE